MLPQPPGRSIGGALTLMPHKVPLMRPACSAQSLFIITTSHISWFPRTGIRFFYRQVLVPLRRLFLSRLSSQASLGSKRQRGIIHLSQKNVPRTVFIRGTFFWKKRILIDKLPNPLPGLSLTRSGSVTYLPSPFAGHGY